MDRKRIINIYVAVLTVITVIGILVGVWRIFGNGGMRIFSSQGDISESMELDSFDKINIDVNVCEVNMQYGDKYEVSYEISGPGAQSHIPVIEVKNGELTITKKAHKRVGISKSLINCRLSVTIPQSANMSDITVNTEVGDFKIKDIACDNFTIDSDVGDVEINNVSANVISINTDVGDLDIKNSTFNTIDIKSNVGDVEVDNTVCELIKGDCNVGDVRLNNVKNAAGGDPQMDIDLDIGDKKVN